MKNPPKKNRRKKKEVNWIRGRIAGTKSPAFLVWAGHGSKVMMSPGIHCAGYLYREPASTAPKPCYLWPTGIAHKYKQVSRNLCVAFSEHKLL